MAKLIKNTAKDIVLPHSQAKLDLYENYLLHYLRVLGLSPYVNKINLFDIYCGIGIYQDGNIGSPLITNKSIKATNDIIKTLGKPLKPISVNINDYEERKIKNVETIINTDKVENCSYEFYNKDADEMLDLASTKVNSYKATERSLVFIDPYGYSQIHRDKIYNLIKNEHTEIILFLPVMQMYRFKDIALNDPNRTCYENLRKFIFSFFPANHKILSDNIAHVFEFINEIKVALSFDGKFYTCSHHIERGKGNYYALFFITSNIYGLDKMVEAKWKLDPIKGKGFTQKRPPSLFDDHFEEVDHNRELDFLKTKIINGLKSGMLSNNEIYELTLRNEFRPTHAKSVLDELIKAKIIDTCNEKGEHISNIGAYYLDYNHFKNNDNKIYFKLL
ncbi:MAG: three-Cys-motif partner protein TcmP [Chitinophagaceae bacterium]